jgi:holo-[acyl-carrier protein] synthase
VSISVGIDVVEIERFRAALQRWPSLEARVFTKAEIETCRHSRDREARLAAKEATFKALGDGWPNVRYHDVEISLGTSGVPALNLTGRAKRLAGQRDAAVSMAHSGGIAIADVALTLETEKT